MMLLRDRETNTLWHHATGEALHGDLIGKSLGDSDVMHQMTADHTLQRFPKARIALSRNSTFLKKLMGFIGKKFYAPDKGGMPIIPPIRRFMDPRDKRLNEMEIGLGVWVDNDARFYQRTTILANNYAIIDKLDERRIVVYIDPLTRTPTAIYSNAMSFWWKGDELHFNNGMYVKNGVMVAANGQTSRLEYTNQIFTRWYGFAYTLPECTVYGQSNPTN